MARKMNPALERREEQVKKDLDGDREKGESPAHKAKVLGGKKEIPSGGLLKTKSCKKCGKSHVLTHAHFK